LSKKKRFLIYIIVGVIIFLCGMVSSSFFERKVYEIKEWVSKPFLPPQEMRTVKLYFSAPQENYLLAEEREIIISLNPNREVEEILEELIKGPRDISLSSTLPSSTRVRDVWVEKNCIYVDFTSSLTEAHPGGSSGELLTVYSIVNTLLDNFPSCSYVQILIQDKPAETLAGHVNITEPLSKNPDLVKNP